MEPLNAQRTQELACTHTHTHTHITDTQTHKADRLKKRKEEGKGDAKTEGKNESLQLNQRSIQSTSRPASHSASKPNQSVMILTTTVLFNEL